MFLIWGWGISLQTQIDIYFAQAQQNFIIIIECF